MHKNDIAFTAKNGYFFNKTIVNSFCFFYTFILLLIIFISSLAIIYKDSKYFELLSLIIVLSIVVFMIIFTCILAIKYKYDGYMESFLFVILVGLYMFFISFPLIYKELKMQKYLKTCCRIV